MHAIPKRSPDLNVLDYAVWSNINKRMRQQEAKWPATKRETRREYLDRLKKTAVNTSKPFLLKAVGDMKKRCGLLLKAKGGLFEEGGK